MASVRLDHTQRLTGEVTWAAVLLSAHLATPWGTRHSRSHDGWWPWFAYKSAPPPSRGRYFNLKILLCFLSLHRENLLSSSFLCLPWRLRVANLAGEARGSVCAPVRPREQRRRALGACALPSPLGSGRRVSPSPAPLFLIIPSVALWSISPILQRALRKETQAWRASGGGGGAAGPARERRGCPPGRPPGRGGGQRGAGVAAAPGPGGDRRHPGRPGQGVVCPDYGVPARQRV
ncbi:hypothetical protein D1007_34425 [Hordeum vulgare]|nr:hypothetical protein D1007_34425 [Hordeum vulgare]